MERTTKIFLLNDTSKALQNQDFSENWFRSGHSFSSQPRYDHFDTAADSIVGKGWRREKNSRSGVIFAPWRKRRRSGNFRIGDPSGIRTPDPLLKRQLLCRLS